MQSLHNIKQKTPEIGKVFISLLWLLPWPPAGATGMCTEPFPQVYCKGTCSFLKQWPPCGWVSTSKCCSARTSLATLRWTSSVFGSCAFRLNIPGSFLAQTQVLTHMYCIEFQIHKSKALRPAWHFKEQHLVSSCHFNGKLMVSWNVKRDEARCGGACL